MPSNILEYAYCRSLKSLFNSVIPYFHFLSHVYLFKSIWLGKFSFSPFYSCGYCVLVLCKRHYPQPFFDFISPGSTVGFYTPSNITLLNKGASSWHLTACVPITQSTLSELGMQSQLSLGHLWNEHCLGHLWQYLTCTNKTYLRMELDQLRTPFTDIEFLCFLFLRCCQKIHYFLILVFN